VLEVSNIDLESLLDLLYSKGSVTLRKIKDPVSASGQTAEELDYWTCSLGIKGYNHNGGSRVSLEGRGKTHREAAEACWTAWEEFINGPEAVSTRARYVEQWQVQRDLYDRATSYERSGHNARYDPGPMEPELY
jgi:hypothetical protein